MMTETLGLYEGGFGSTLQIFVLGHIYWWALMTLVIEQSNRNVIEKRNKLSIMWNLKFICTERLWLVHLVIVAYTMQV